MATIEYPSSICLVCNATFGLPISSQQLRQFIHTPEELNKVDECFALNFGLSSEEMSRASFSTKPDTIPFCSKCSPMAKDFLKLQRRLTEIQDKLSKARLELASIIVNTYVYTLDDSPFFEMKNMIFEKWYSKIDEIGSIEIDEIGSIEIDEIEMFDGAEAVKKQIQDENFNRLSEKQQNSEKVSREVALLKRKGKGDVLPISIDEEETEEVTCGVCNKICRSKENLALHMKTHSGDSRHVCSVCNKTFFNVRTMKKHIQTQHTSAIQEVAPLTSVEAYTPISTEFAKVTMENGEEAHLIIGTRVETPPPELEDQTLSSQEDNSLPDMDIDEGSELEAEIDNNSELHCNECMRSFATKVTLTKHIRTVHLKTAKVECPICKGTTRDHYNLAKHVLTHNPKLTKIIYNCPYCGDGFLVRRDFFGHFKAIHGENEKVCPAPLIRALEDHEPVDIDVGKRKRIKIDSSFASSQSFERATVFDAASEPVSDHPTGNPEVPLSTLDPVQKSKQHFFDSFLPGIGLQPVKPAVVQESLEKAKEVQIRTNDSGIVSSDTKESPVYTTIAIRKAPRSRKIRKKKRRFMLTYTTRSKLLRQRLRISMKQDTVIHPAVSVLPSSQGQVTVKKEYNKGNDTSVTVKLMVPKETFLETVEIDNAFIREVQADYPTLRNMNFNVLLALDKLQTVMLSPKRETEDEDPPLDISSFLESTMETEDSTNSANVLPPSFPSMPKLTPVLPPKKLVGPKSKLEEIIIKSLRRRKVGPTATNSVQPTTVVKTYGPKLKLPEHKTTTDTNKLPQSTLVNQMPTMRTYGPKSKITKIQFAKVSSPSSKSLELSKSMAPAQLSAQIKDTAKESTQGMDWKTMGAWFTQKNQANKVRLRTPSNPSNWKSFATSLVKKSSLAQTIKSTSPLPTTTNIETKVGGKTVILKTVLVKKPVDAHMESLGTEISSGTTDKSVALTTPQQLEISPLNKTAYFTDPSKILFPSTSKSTLSQPFLLTSLQKMAGVTNQPSLNNRAAQISNMFHQALPIQTETQSVHPVKPKVFGMPRPVIKTVVTNPNAVLFGKGSPSAGPIIESTRSLAKNISPFHLARTQYLNEIISETEEPEVQYIDPDPMMTFQSTPEGKSAQVEALLRNSNIDVSIIGPERQARSESITNSKTNEFKMPRLPAGITLVQVEDVLKGNTNTHESIKPPITELKSFVIGKPGPKSKTRPPGLAMSTNMFSQHHQSRATNVDAINWREEYSPMTSGRIRIKNFESLREPQGVEIADIEESHQYQQNLNQLPARPARKRPSPLGVTEVKLPPLWPRQVNQPQHRNRRIRQNEVVPFIKYSEHIRQQQRGSTVPTLQYGHGQLTMTPVSNSTTVYIPVQTTFTAGASTTIPTFFQVPTTTLTTQVGDIILSNNFMNNV